MPEQSPGREEGILIFQKICNFEKPIVLPASINSCGTLFKASVKFDVIGKNTIKTPITILLLMPYPSHNINNGAKANTGIDWLANKMGITQSLSLAEDDIVNAVIIPIIQPIKIEANISTKVYDACLNNSSQLVYIEVKILDGVGSINGGNSNIIQLASHIRKITIAINIPRNISIQ